MRDRHVKLGVTMPELAMHGLEELEKKMRRNEPNLNPFDAARLIEVGARPEKAARGKQRSNPTVFAPHLFPRRPGNSRFNTLQRTAVRQTAFPTRVHTYIAL